MRDLMGKPPKIWKEAEEYLPLIPEQRIMPLNPGECERLFLERHAKLSR